jgi:Fic-DOC domain mobile mystery protein B
LTDVFDEPDGATPLEPAEREGLLQTWITHRTDLNEAERDNIVRGAAWARKRRSSDELVSESFMKKLHSRMFGDVWAWAGSYRATEKNLGIPAYRVAEEVRQLLNDVRYWLEHETYAPGEIALRFHHRLVAIHPFPTGNGRHARLMADLLNERQGGQPFTWGGAALADAGTLRSRYIAALRAADNHDIEPLIAFARS